MTRSLKLCLITADGHIPLDAFALSPAAAARREPEAWLRLYEEMRLVYLREFAQMRMAGAEGRGGAERFIDEEDG
jgi:hypothetical protein